MSIDNVSRIKEKLGIVEVVSAYIKLDRAGVNLKGRCPFHNEKTASFFVSPERGTYKCFGCGVGGDIFSFVEQFEGVDFVGALKILAEKAGIELVSDNSHERKEINRMYSVMEDTTKFFETGLSQGSTPYLYLQKRGLTDETIKKFRIGFVKNEWRSLHDFLSKKGYSDSEMESAGLIKKTEGKLYDRFRGRIIFPLFDSSGRVIAFSGRIFEDDGKSAKYLNSPETPLFVKSKVLYGYNFAKNDIRKRGFSILVEGQMDIIMSHQSGYTNTIATSGTALTEYHLEILKRLSDKVVMAFDGDSAGLNAANKGAKLALSQGMEVKLLEIPGGMDPADFILKDEGSWKKALINSVHIIDFNLNTLIRQEEDKRKLGLKIKEIVLPLVLGLPSEIEQDYFISMISSKLGVSKESVQNDASGLDDNLIYATTNGSAPIKGEEAVSKKKKALRELSGILHWQRLTENKVVSLLEFEKSVKNIIGEEIFNKIENIPDKLKEEIIFEAEVLNAEVADLSKKMDELVMNLKKEILLEQRSELFKKIEFGDDSEENLRKINELSKKIEEI